jgi:hypothetical protein
MQKKFVAFNIKQQRIKFFYNWIAKKEEHVKYVDSGHAMAAVSI